MNIGVSKIDAVILSLGHNDCVGSNVLSDSFIITLKQNLQNIINAFTTNDNTTKILVSLNGLDAVDCTIWTNYTESRNSSIYKVNSFKYRRAVIDVVSSLANANIEVGQGCLSLSRYDNWAKFDKQEIRLPLTNTTDITFFKNFNFSGVQYFVKPTWDEVGQEELSVIGFDTIDNSLICERFVNNTPTEYDKYPNGISFTKKPIQSGSLLSGWSSSSAITTAYPYNTTVLPYTNRYSKFSEAIRQSFLDPIHPWVDGYIAIGKSIGAQLQRMLF
jgi:hypothetical protein